MFYILDSDRMHVSIYLLISMVIRSFRFYRLVLLCACIADRFSFSLAFIGDRFHEQFYFDMYASDEVFLNNCHFLRKCW